MVFSVPVSWSPLYLCHGHLCTCVMVFSVPVRWSPLNLCHGHLCHGLLYLCHGRLCTCAMVTSVHVSVSPLYICHGLLCTCAMVSSVPVSWSPLYLCRGHLCTCVMVPSVPVLPTLVMLSGLRLPLPLLLLQALMLFLKGRLGKSAVLLFGSSGLTFDSPLLGSVLCCLKTRSYLLSWCLFSTLLLFRSLAMTTIKLPLVE